MDNVFPVYQAASKKLNSYVEKRFFSEKPPADEVSMTMFYQLMRRLVQD
jgi:hypothetical protein